MSCLISSSALMYMYLITYGINPFWIMLDDDLSPIITHRSISNSHELPSSRLWTLSTSNQYLTSNLSTLIYLIQNKEGQDVEAKQCLSRRCLHRPFDVFTLYSYYKLALSSFIDTII